MEQENKLRGDSMSDSDILDQISLYSDSEEVAAGVGKNDTYWGEEGEVHILGLWKVALELAEEVKMLRDELAEHGRWE
jgi:hypothetical protein